jgi:hypothetical protein
MNARNSESGNESTRLGAITNTPDLDRGVHRMSSGRTERFANGASGSRGLRYAFSNNWGNLKAAQRFIFGTTIFG